VYTATAQNVQIA